jgi:hypothetical protein
MFHRSDASLAVGGFLVCRCCWNRRTCVHVSDGACESAVGRPEMSQPISFEEEEKGDGKHERIEYPSQLIAKSCSLVTVS